EDRVKIVDKTLWTFSTNAFIPHGDRSLGFCEKQPIYFTSQLENPNGAKTLLVVDTLDYPRRSEFEKIFFVFEDKRRAENANLLFEDLKKEKENVNYWKQSSKGWEKLA
ncbi:MAG: DNA polymerase III subunit chi, partial [Holosporaceae bacterium]|nr:DNA polymerase III subunit chi [Holosporaceae bacterium]